MPQLIVGLGNPGEQYRHTRHNIGFLLVDAIHQQCPTAPAFSYNKKFQAEESALSTKLRLLKPQTFMNNSGSSVAAAGRFYQLPPEEILVAHDELDLAIGTVKLKKGGGHAGHNGLRDISAKLGTNDYWRLRIGIGRPTAQAVDKYVLSPPTADENITLTNSLQRILDCWETIISGDYESVAQTLHTANQTPTHE